MFGEHEGRDDVNGRNDYLPFSRSVKETRGDVGASQREESTLLPSLLRVLPGLPSDGRPVRQNAAQTTARNCMVGLLPRGREIVVPSVTV